jgi:hypothetical protein
MVSPYQCMRPQRPRARTMGAFAFPGSPERFGGHAMATLTLLAYILTAISYVIWS